MRPAVIIIALLALLAGCSSDSAETSETDTMSDTTAASAAVEDASVDSAGVDSTTAPPDATTAVEDTDRADEVYAVHVDRRIPFTTDTERPLGTTGLAGGYVDVFAPEGDGPWPVVVFFHGAANPAFPDVDREPHDTGECPPECEAFYDAHLSYLATRGVVVVNVAYDWRVPAALDVLVDDVGCVGPLVANLVPAYNGDPSRTVVAGHSRGATIASALALSGFSAAPPASCVEQGDARPDVVGLVGLSGDYPFHGYEDPEDPERIVLPLVSSDSFAPTDEVVEGLTVAEAFATLSASPHIGVGPQPAIRLFYGTQDDFSEAGYATGLADSLVSAGYDATVTEYEGYHHESILFPSEPGEPAEPTESNLANLDAILDLALQRASP